QIRLVDNYSGWAFSSRRMIAANRVWKVYPTMAQDHVNILVGAQELGSYYKIMDIYGRTRISGILDDKTHRIPVKSLDPGNYFIQLSQHCQNTESKKFIKQ